MRRAGGNAREKEDGKRREDAHSEVVDAPLAL